MSATGDRPPRGIVVTAHPAAAWVRSLPAGLDTGALVERAAPR